MIRIGLTGGIATGKSYVVRRLREAGVPVVDADVLARDAVARGSPGLAAVVERFGQGILTAAGDLDRVRLGEIVFRDAEARHALEAIVHPIVRRRTEEFFATLPPDTAIAVADIPLLFEAHREGSFDQVVVVACSRATQLERLMRRNNLSREQAEHRIAAQLPIEEKVHRADHVIRTEGTYEETDAQVTALVEALRAS